MFRNKGIVKDLANKIVNHDSLINNLNFGFDNFEDILIEVVHDPDLGFISYSRDRYYSYDNQNKILSTLEKIHDNWIFSEQEEIINNGVLIDNYKDALKAVSKYDIPFVGLSTTKLINLKSTDGADVEIAIQSMIDVRGVKDFTTNKIYLIAFSAKYNIATSDNDNYILTIEEGEPVLEKVKLDKLRVSRFLAYLTEVASSTDTTYCKRIYDYDELRYELDAKSTIANSDNLEISPTLFNVHKVGDGRLIDYLSSFQPVQDGISFVNKIKLSTSKNRNQKMLEKYIEEYSLNSLISTRVKNIDLGFYEYGSESVTTIEKLDTDKRVYLIRKFVPFSDLIKELPKMSNSTNFKVVGYFAISSEEGFFEATRVTPDLFLPRLVGSTKELYNVEYKESETFNYHEDPIFKYMAPYIDKLKGPAKLIFLTEMLKSNFLEPMLKSNIESIVNVVLFNKELKLHRTIENKVGALFGKIKPNEKSFNKIVGMTSYQAEFILKSPFKYTSPMAFHLKMIFKPEEYEKSGYTSFPGIRYRRRVPAKEKHVSITEIDKDEFAAVANVLLQVYDSYSITEHAIENLDEMISTINALPISLTDRIKYLKFLNELLVGSVRLVNISGPIPNFNHLIDYFIYMRDNLTIVIKSGFDLLSYTDDPSLIQDRMEILRTLVDAKEQEEYKITFERRYDKYWKKFEYSDNNFSIIAPKEINQIYMEGTKLSHCVGSYVSQVATGRTNIFFVRENKDIDKPFYTLELNNSNEIVQIRGRHNVGPTAEVKNFVEKFKDCKLRKEYT